MTVADFMAECLGHPELGYYQRRDPFGSAGDFITAPEVSQMFGEMIGLWCVEVWQTMGSPSSCQLVELGPGRGTLMADALRAANALPAFRAALSVHLVETSDLLAAKQRETLASCGVPRAWHRDGTQIPAGPAIFLANEFFDALPVSQHVRTHQGWHERVVVVGEDDMLTFAVSPVPTLNFEKAFAGAIGDAPIGAIIEHRSLATALEIIRHLKTFGGAALIVDYGYAESQHGETLQALRGHAPVDPLVDPGETDLTAHVDFGALAHAGRASGVQVSGPLAQGEFLRCLGITQRAARLKDNATPRQAAEIDSALARLIAPEQMGELFKVLAFADRQLGVLPGFATRDSEH
jgi:NADH dehydrogenase [ubiquinone] 1 alpha subcomplex assembly factor 7